MNITQRILGQTFQVQVTPDLIEAIQALVKMLNAGTARKVEADSQGYTLSAWKEVQPNGGKVSVLIKIEEP